LLDGEGLPPEEFPNLQIQNCITEGFKPSIISGGINLQ